MKAHEVTAAKHQGYASECSSKALANLEKLLDNKWRSGSERNVESECIVLHQKDAAFHSQIARTAMGIDKREKST